MSKRSPNNSSGGDPFADADRWQIVETWFHELAPLPTKERHERLKPLFQEDPELARYVVEVLEFDSTHNAEAVLEEGSLQETNLWSDLVESMDHDSLSQQELFAGPFKVGRELGRGGMAVVHLGERTGEDFQQIVAIKRLLGSKRQEFTDRLLEERRILASLRHPNIAHLIDGGTDSSGNPFLALEYVEGQPINEYCDARRLGVKRRIELVLQACSAVQHAHSALVVHQDLKPSNILVDQAGQVKLLDFGIAGLLDASDPARDVKGAAGPLTPRYAAPEQFLGTPTTTATDVYGLGLVLYELLVGRLPYTVQRSNRQRSDLDDYRSAVLEQDPADPLTALETIEPALGDTETIEAVAALRSVSVRGLRRSLRGDLGTIFVKALHKDPENRYQSADALADDLASYLERKPVQARVHTVPYVLSKFLRRRAWAVTAGTLVLLSLSVGLVAAITQANRARQQTVLTEEQRRRAETEMARAVKIKEVLAEIIQGAGPGNDQTEKLTPVQFLERGLERVLPSLEESPDDMASILGEISVIFRRLGYTDRSRTLAQQVIEVRRTVVGRPGDLSQALYHLAVIEIDAHNEDAAEGILNEIVELEEQRFAARERDEPMAQDQRAYAAHSLGTVFLRRRDYVEAERHLKRAIELFGADNATADSRIAVAEGDLAFLLSQQGKLEEAKERYQTVLALLQDVHGERSSRAAVVLNNLGRIDLELGDFESAERLMTEALSIDEEIFGPNRPSQASELAWLGEIAARRGRHESALQRYRQALAVQADRAPDHAWVLVAKANLARAAVKLAEHDPKARSEALAQEALALTAEILEPAQQRWGTNHRRKLSIDLTRLRASRLTGNNEKSLRELKELCTRVHSSLGAENPLAIECQSFVERWHSSD